MRINWGVRMIILYCSFVVFMLTMVYLTAQEHFDLVTPDYYAQELKFQQVIDGKNNYHALQERISVKQTETQVQISLPASNTNIEKGEVYFYRPDNAKLDLRIPIQNQLALQKTTFSKGMYQIKTSWVIGAKAYFNEQSLYIY